MYTFEFYAVSCWTHISEWYFKEGTGVLDSILST